MNLHLANFEIREETRAAAEGIKSEAVRTRAEKVEVSKAQEIEVRDTSNPETP